MNNKNPRSALKANYKICENCDRFEECKHDLQKILPCVNIVHDYYNEIKRGFCMYPFQGDFRHQPIWFKDLLDLCYSVMAEIQTELSKRS